MKNLFDIVLKGCSNKKVTPGSSGNGGFMVVKEKRGRPCTVHVGERFGRLVVVRRAQNGAHRKVRFICRCDCGNEFTVLADSLRNGTTKSCGCLRRELMARRAEALAEALKDK